MTFTLTTFRNNIYTSNTLHRDLGGQRDVVRDLMVYLYEILRNKEKM